MSGLETALEKDSACVSAGLSLHLWLREPNANQQGRSSVDKRPKTVLTLRSRVDGNPLFLEERFLSLVQTGALVQKEDSWSLSGNAPKMFCPTR